MKRIPLFVLLILICLLPGKQTSAGEKQADAPPNIVFIMADDMSYYDMSGLGQKHFHTPNLDELMDEGLFFHQAYAGSPECAPSRGSLLTGMHMGHCRIRCNRSFRGQEYLEDEDVTIAEMMKEAGYATGMFGKWGVGVPGSPGTPDKQGFDYSIGYYDQLRAHGFFPNYLMENGEVIPLPENYGYDMRNSYRHSGSPAGRHSYDENGKILPKGVKDPTKAIYSQNMIQEKALEFINRHQEEPFFLYYPTQLPHGPVIAPDISKFLDKPWDMKHMEWAAMVELLDAHVGQIVERLEELGLRENTLILFSSDNGYAHWGYNGRERYRDDPIFDNKGPWDKGKFIATDGGSRIPFFANWPNVIQPGTESDVLVALYDILPTACEIAGLTPPETDGESFLPILTGEFPSEKQLHDYLYWENGSHNRDKQSARFRNWFVSRENVEAPVKVFDLSRDITCSVNLAASKPDIVQEALSIFEEAHSPSFWYSNPEDTEEEKAVKAAKAEKQILKSTKPNSRRPQSMKELKKMLEAQKTITNVYPDDRESSYPNVLIIYADDLGYGDVQCYNRVHGKIPTPNIDRLAKEGMRFTDAHSSSAVCSPSRYTLLTGRYHWRTRLQKGIVPVFGPPLIDAKRITIGGLVKQHAYQTACIGKWHLGWDWPIPEGKRDMFVAKKKKIFATDEHRAMWQEVFSQTIPGGPTSVGFDEYFGVDIPNWPPFCFIENDRTQGIPSVFGEGPLFGKRQASRQGPSLKNWKLEDVLPALGDRSADFIEGMAKSQDPFLLYLSLTSPHTPLSVNEAWEGKSGLGLYADLVMETDALVGKVLETLEKSGQAGNTLVLFTSDNGCAPYIGNTTIEEARDTTFQDWPWDREKHEDMPVATLEEQGHFPSGPLRGYKSDAWEGGHRVPFIVRWPGRVKPGSSCSQLVHQADVLATLAHILDVSLPPDAGEDSYSLLPLLKGDDNPVREHAVSASISGIPSLRSGPWKLILTRGSGGWSPGGDEAPVQLYNLTNDIGEIENLACKNPERVARMKALLEKLITDGRSTPGPAQENDVEVITYSMN